MPGKKSGINCRGGILRHLTIFLAVNVGTALLLSGCSARPPVIEPAPHGAVVKSARIGMYSKSVMTKKEPDTLLADDGTICRVSADRYRDTAVHTLAYCNWQ